MKKKSQIKIWAVAALMAFAATACTDDEVKRPYTFNATMEALQVESENNNSKVFLYNEQWTYWEEFDHITIRGNKSTESAWAYLVTSAGDDFENYNGVFATTLTEDEGDPSTYFVGLFPHSDKNVINYAGSDNKGFTASVYLAPTQNYRHDSSYARDVLPMAAWYGGRSWEAGDVPRLDFHSLAGLVRLQLVNDNEATKITKITLTSLAPTGVGADTVSKKHLAGRFPVKRLFDFNAHLDGNESNHDENPSYELELAMPEGGLDFPVNALKSFYVVLPAYHGMDTTTYYHLQMTVYTKTGDNAVESFSKNFTVRTRRNGITYMRAMNIKSFTDATQNEAVLVGNGTSMRPFKIYSVADLRYLRDCFNSPDIEGNVHVNGQVVTANTWFRIMRSDIVLTDANWRNGISNFKGHMTYYSTAPIVTNGIVNQSYVPLFASISADGVVERLAIVTNSDLDFITYGSGNDYSPLCGTNNGRIENCRNISPSDLEGNDRRFSGKNGGCYAGICITNYGTITGCDYAAIRTLTNNCHFAGICKENRGTVQGCAISAPASVEGPGNRGGIVYQNYSEVRDCYCNITYSNFTNTANWGGIVYQNNSGLTRLVSNCYVSPSAIIRSNGTVGGIVCNNAGKVDYCHNESYALQGKDVGGVVASMTGGVVSNCYINDPTLYLTLYNPGSGAHSAGGIVGVLGAGSVQNCFAVIKHIVVNSSDATGTYGVLVGRITANAASVNNCYAYEVNENTPQLYGSNNNGTLTNCHLLGATQTGVDGITTINNGTLATLLGSLNANRPVDGLGISGYEWTRGLADNESSDSALPILVPPASAKHRRTR